MKGSKKSGKFKKCILIIGLVLLIPWAILAILDTVDIDLSSLSGRFSIFNDIQELEDALSPYVIDQASGPAVCAFFQRSRKRCALPLNA